MSSDRNNVSRACEIWNIAVQELRTKLSENTISQWFEAVQVVALDDCELVLGVSDDFFSETFINNYGKLLSSTLSSIDATYTFRTEIGYAPLPTPAPVVAVAPAEPITATPSSPLRIPFQRTLRGEVRARHTGPQHTFENFVVGEENRHAFSFAQMVADSPGVCNPLYIYGDTGIGKTHLIHAIRERMLQNTPGINVRYATCEDILNEFVDSLKHNKYGDFRSSLRDVDAILVDDIHSLANKEQLQEQFFNAFNALYREGKQIVLTSDKQPGDIIGLEKRLISRFEQGLTAQITPLGFEIRLAILRQTAGEYMCEVPDEALNFLAENISSSVRRLKSSLLRVVGVASTNDEPITIALINNVLHELLESECSAASVSIEKVYSTVAAHFGLRVVDIISDHRPRNIAEPRMIAMYLSRQLTGASYPEIGKAFGKTHATVLHAVKKVPELTKNNENLRRSVALLERQLKLK